MTIHRIVSLLVTLVILAVNSLSGMASARATGKAEHPRRELVQLRTARSKVFETADGLEYQLYLRPVHFLTSDQRWEEIRPALRGGPQGEPFAFQATGVPFQAGFTNRSDRNEVEFRYGPGAIRFGLPVELGSGAFLPRQAGNSLAYRRTGGEVEYRYEIGPNSLKETVILHQPTAQHQFSFPVELESVTLSDQEDGSIAALGPEGEVLWRITPPVAYDAAGESPPRITQTLTQQDGTQVLVITLDPAWMADPARQWPVVIDPTLVLEPDPTDGMDTGIYHRVSDTYDSNCFWVSGSESYASYPYSSPLATGNSNSEVNCSSFSNIDRVAFLKFNLHSLPKGVRIDSARLMLYTTGSATGYVRPVAREWDEASVTFTYPWSRAGALSDLDGAVASATVKNAGWTEWDITGLLGDWLAGRRPNYGVALTTTTTSSQVLDKSFSFQSSDSSDPTMVPYMLIRLTADTALPAVTIDSPAESATVAAPLQVSLTATDPPPGEIEQVEVEIDGRPVGLWTGGLTAPALTLSDVAGVLPGSHTVQVRAADRAGNSITVDRSFTFAGTAVPNAIGALGAGGGQVQLNWAPIPGDPHTYNVYRDTSPDFVPTAQNRVAAGLATPSYTDTPLAPGITYFYRITAVSPAGIEGGPTRPVAATPTPAPSLTMAFAGNVMDRTAPLPYLQQLAYNPQFTPGPQIPEWQSTSAAFGQLSIQDGSSYVTTADMPALVPGHLITFDVLGAINFQRAAAGRSKLQAGDLQQVVTDVSVQWAGFGTGVSGTTAINGAKLRLWNDVQRVWSAEASHTAGTPTLLTAQETNQAGQMIDSAGRLRALAQPSYPAGASAPASISSDYAILTVGLRSEAPDQVRVTPIGNGQILVDWPVSALSYQVYRADSPTFTPGPENTIGQDIAAPSIVDSVANGLQPGVTYYYKVAPADPGSGFTTSAGVMVDTSPAAWLAFPNSTHTAYQRCGVGSTVEGASVMTAANVANISFRDGATAYHQCSYSYQAAHLYKFLPLGEVRQQLGQPGLTAAQLKERLSTLSIDWTGYGHSGTIYGATLRAWNFNTGTWTVLTPTLTQTAAERYLLQVPNPSAYISSTGELILAVLSPSGGSGTGAVSRIYTDQIRVGVTVRPAWALSAGVGADGNVTLTWSGSGRYHVYRSVISDTGFIRISTVPVENSFVDITALVGHTYFYTLRPVEGDSSEGAPLTEVSVKAGGRVEDTALTYTGQYWYNSNSTYYSGGTMRYAHNSYVDTTYSASYTFVGTGVQYLATTGSCYGKVSVTLDGVLEGTTSLYSSSTLRQQVMYARSGLTPGTHTIRIAYAEPSSGTCKSINVDALDVSDDRPPPSGATVTINGQSRTISWSAAVGAAGYHVYRSDLQGNWYRRITSSPVTGTSYTDPLDPATKAYYVVTAVDPSGRESAPSAEAQTHAGLGRYDAGDPLVQLLGTWTFSDSPDSFMQTLHEAGEMGSDASLAFSAGGVRLLGERGPAYGILRVLLDGEPVADVDLFAAIPTYQQELFRTEGLTGSHSLTVQYTGAKNASSAGTAINLDGIDVLPGDRPWFLTAEPGPDGLRLQWVGTALASLGYRVQRAPASGGPYTVITDADVTGTEFTDTTITPGSQFYYTVAGVQSDGSLTPVSNEVAGGRRQTGLDGRRPYLSLPWAGATAYVNLSNGHLVMSVTDALIPFSRMAVVLRRTYNSGDGAQRGAGLGWRLNAQQEIVEQGSTVVWVDGDGSETLFTRQADGSYKPEAQVFATLRRLDDGWSITRKDGVIHRFDVGGRMVSVADRNGNQIAYTFDTAGRLTAMRPLANDPATPGSPPVAAGNPWILQYDSSTGLLSAVADGAGRVYRYGYDPMGHLTSVTDPTGAVTTYAYDAGNRLYRVTDPEGRTGAVEYADGKVAAYRDGAGQRSTLVYSPGQASVADPLGNATTFVLTADQRLGSVTNALGGTTDYAYDGDGNLTEVRDPLGRVTRLGEYGNWGNPGLITDALNQQTRITYDSILHLPTEVEDPLGRRQVTEYDAAGNPVRVTNAAGTADAQIIRYAYDSRGLLLQTIDPRGSDSSNSPSDYTTTYAYDSRGWLIRATDPLGGVTMMDYDPAGNLTVQTDPLGRQQHFEYDQAGRQISVTYADGSVVRFQYDRSGLLTRTTDPMGAETLYAYDQAGRLIAQTDPLGGTTRLEYDAAGRQVAVVDARGFRSVTRYDALGRPIAAADPEGHETFTEYDAVGNAVAVTLPNGFRMTAEYDSLSRQVRATIPPATQEMHYDAVGNRVLVRDGNGNWTRYEHDSLNRLVRVYDALNLDTAGQPVPGARYTGYVYDKAGNRIMTVDPRDNPEAPANPVRYEYDAMNHLVRETNQVGDVQEYGYDAAGQQVRSVNGNGTVTNYAYDLRGNLVKIEYDNDCDQVQFRYDRAGRKVATIDQWGTTVYRYNSVGQLLEHADPFQNSIRYTYDPNGNVVQMALREGTWSYGYDSGNRLVSVVDHQGLRARYTYSADGRRVRTDLPYGILLTYAFDPASNRLTELKYSKPGVTGSLSLAYQYDTKGNVTSFTQTTVSGSSSTTTTSTTYEYDRLDRLTRSILTQGSTKTTYSYTYDPVGNRLTRTKQVNTNTAVTDSFTYDLANRVLEVIRSNSVQQRYVYDGAGRLLLVSGKDPDTGRSTNERYEYDDFDRLIKVSSGVTITSSGYDGDGRRLFRKTYNRSDMTKNDAVYYQYDGMNVVAERDGTGTAQAFVTRGLGGELVSLNRKMADGTFVYLTDRLGSVVQLVDKSFAVKNSYQYGDFGEVTSGTEGVLNDWKFTGALYDSDPGLYHLYSRYYRPSDGRFITQDTYKGSIWEPWTQNLYVYVGNNPVNYVDPTGHDAVPKDALPNQWHTAGGNVAWQLYYSGYDYHYFYTGSVSGLNAQFERIQRQANVVQTIGGVADTVGVGATIVGVAASAVATAGVGLAAAAVGGIVYVTSNDLREMNDIVHQLRGFLDSHPDAQSYTVITTQSLIGYRIEQITFVVYEADGTSHSTTIQVSLENPDSLIEGLNLTPANP